MSKSTRTVAYLRCSTDDQTDRSIPQQKNLIEQFAAREGYQIEQWFIDEGLTGTTGRRSQYQELLAEAKAGNVQTVLVEKRNRLSREHPIHYFRDVATLFDAGVQLVSVMEGLIDWNDDYGWLKDGITQKEAHGESLTKSQQALRGMAASAMLGHWQGGKPPFGYRVRYEPHPTKPNKLIAYLEHHPEQAEFIRYIFRRHNEGASSLTIQQELPGRWCRATIGKILRNPRYVQPTTWYTRSSSKFHKLEKSPAGTAPVRARNTGKRQANPQGEWLLGQATCPPIIDQATWDLSQDRLRRQASPRGRQNRYALSRLVVCGHCQSPMSGECHRGNGHKYFGCNRAREFGRKACPAGGGRVRESQLLDGLAELLRRVLFSEENRLALRQMVQDYAASQPRQEAVKARRLQQELQQLDRRHGELEAALMGNAGSVSVLLRAMEQNREKHARLARELAEVTPEPTIDVEALENQFWMVCDRMEEAFACEDPDRLQAALASLLERVEVTWTNSSPKRRLKNNRDKPPRTVKRLASVTVVLRDDPLLRVLLGSGAYIGVPVYRPYYRPYRQVYVAPAIYVRPAPVYLQPVPTTVYVQPAPATVYVQPAQAPVYVQPVPAQAAVPALPAPSYP